MVLPVPVLAGALGIGAVAGLLIGSVGVGGIVLVPSLVQFRDIDVQTAIASSLLSYLFAGLAGASIYMRHGTVAWDSAVWLILGAIPGAFAGAFVLQHVSDFIIKLVLYSVIFLSALLSLYRTLTAPSSEEESAANGAGKPIDGAVDAQTMSS